MITTMKKINLTLSALLTLGVALTGCSSDENLPTTDERVALQVNSGIQTRAFDDQWEENDEIGIFMLNNKQNTIADGYGNVPYKVASAGKGGKAFTPVSTVIYFPVNDDRRDFTAYYPYSADKMANGVYSIDLTKQDPQKAIDFMVAEKVTGKNRTNPDVSFQFAHKLAKIVMEIKAGDGLMSNDLQGVKVTLTDQPTTGTFNVLTDKDVTVSTDGKAGIDLLVHADGTKAEGIVFPCDSYAGMKFVFATASMGSYEWSLEESEKATKFEAGKKYLYTIIVNRTEIQVTSSITDWLPGNGNGETGDAE